jgi:hypothetical protein
MAYGEARTPEQEHARERQENDRLQKLIAACLDEAEVGHDAFPKRLPLKPLELLVEMIEAVSSPRPSIAAAVLRYAKRTDRERKARQARCNEALKMILIAAREGGIKIRGRLALHRAARFEEIPLNFLMSDITLDWSLRHLGAAPGRGEATNTRAIIAPNGAYSDAYFDVLVDRRELVKKFKLRAGSSALQEPTQPTLQEFERWYAEVHLRNLERQGIPSTEKVDQDAARQAFPHMKFLQAAVREMRRRHKAPSRRGRGRPKMRTD